MMNISTARLDQHARTLGVNLTYPQQVNELTERLAHAATFAPPQPDPLGAILINTDPAKWADAVKKWAAADALPGNRAIQQAVAHHAEPAITSAIRAHADHLVAQVYPAAAKAADTLNASAAAGITDLSDYQSAAVRGIAPQLIDAQIAIKQLEAYSNFLGALTDPARHGPAWFDIGALIDLPDTLAPRPVTMTHTAFGDARYAVAGASYTHNDADTDTTWKNNLEIRNLSIEPRLLAVASGRYSGFTLTPARTVAEAHQRADQAADAQREAIIAA